MIQLLINQNEMVQTVLDSIFLPCGTNSLFIYRLYQDLFTAFKYSLFSLDYNSCKMREFSFRTKYTLISFCSSSFYYYYCFL